MVRFGVFLGAPSAADVDTDPSGYVWQTLQEPSQVPYLRAMLHAASRRISLLYQNVIFDSQDPDSDHPHIPTANTTGTPSFLRPSGSLPQRTYETLETGTSIEYSDASSIASPRPLHKVTLLSSLYIAAKSGRGSRKVNILLADLEVHGPDAILVKKCSVCKLIAWRDIADAWDGLGPSPGLKRGDIVYFESTFSLPNLMATWETGSIIRFTSSPYNRPITGDLLVSKVTALVRWFENIAGLPGA
ncbi:hypothetical protein OG21DRAFT_1479362 [Imleria badia]|nr:hypothetical protein OG21DRAFT_1479362 [Imleria badia]